MNSLKSPVTGGRNPGANWCFGWGGSIGATVSDQGPNLAVLGTGFANRVHKDLQELGELILGRNAGGARDADHH
ncbi:hypothetical protein [Hyphomonas sp.]|uniref:hypothetical protein n=1 Tax=Hyphomonas sp. TaxID=87 RepID=UPI0025BA7326|nr:hypothetical protein [Hyphomonas sp.]